MSCTFRYCLVVLCVFLIEVLLSSIWTSFGAFSINHFICYSQTACKYEDNAWLLLFFVCLYRFIELWVELHCRFLHTNSDKNDTVFTHQKCLYTMPFFFIVALVLSCYLSYGPQFLLFGLCGGILMGVVTSHVKFFTKVFHDEEIPERQYDFIVHLGRSTSLMLTCIIIPFAIRHYFGIFQTRLLLAILMGNVIPLVMMIKALGSRQQIKKKNAIKSFVQYDSLVYDPSDVGSEVVFEEVETEAPNSPLFVLSLEEKYERDLQAAIEASMKDSFEMSGKLEVEQSEVHMEQSEVQIHQNNQILQNKDEEKKFEAQGAFEKIEIEDPNKIEYVGAIEETQSNKSIIRIDKQSLEVGAVSPKKISSIYFSNSSDSSDSSSNANAGIHGYHTVEIHAEPSTHGKGNTSTTSSMNSSRKYHAVNVQELDKIETLPTKPQTVRRRRSSPPPRQPPTPHEQDFEEFSRPYCQIFPMVATISFYPSILSVVYSNSMCLIYLASFPFMLYQLRLKQENSRTETIEEATFFSLFFLGLCWHIILWILYYFSKFMFVKYIFGLVLLGSSLLLYFLTDYVDFAGPLFGLGYGITSYHEKDLYAYFMKSNCSAPIIFNFRVMAAFLSLLTCAILPAVAKFVTILSVYSAVPFFTIAIGLLLTVMKQKVNDDQQMLLPVKRERRRNYRNTDETDEWEEVNEDLATQSVDYDYVKEPPVKEPVRRAKVNKTSSSKNTSSWKNLLSNVLESGGFSPYHNFHDVLVRF